MTNGEVRELQTKIVMAFLKPSGKLRESSTSHVILPTVCHVRAHFQSTLGSTIHGARPVCHHKIGRLYKGRYRCILR